MCAMTPSEGHPSSRWILAAALVAILLPLAGRRATAMPMFARKYGMQCAQCHTMPPRLTPFGYAFLRAGYRLTKEDEQPAPSLANSVAAFTEIHAQDTGPDGDRGFDSDGLEVQLATSVGKVLATKMMYEFPSDEPASFEEAWVQYNSDASGPFFTVRGGQIPVLSGFKMGGDRNITLTDPMLFGPNGPLTDTNLGNFAIAGLERGFEFGYTDQGLTGKLSWLNGVDETGDGAVPLQGHRANDWVIQGDYLLGDLGTSLSAFYYRGKTPFLDAGYTNTFWRSGLFASYDHPLVPGEPGIPKLTLELNAGLLWGSDTVAEAPTESSTVLQTSGLATSKVKSRGSVVELALYQTHRTAYVARWDSVKPSDQAGSPLNMTTKAWTLAVAQLPSTNFRWEVEYRDQTDPKFHSLIASFWFFY